MEENTENQNINETQIMESTASDQQCNNKPHCNGTRCLIICNIVLFVALAVLYALFFTKMSKSKENPDAKAPVVAENGALKIAYINSDTLMAKYQYAKDLEAEMMAYKTSKENSYKQQITQYENDYQNYLQNGDKMTLSQQQAKEAELKQRLEKLQSLEGELTMQIQEKLAKENEKMINAIYAFIREYNNANQQFDIILSNSFINSPTLYINPAMDITDEIVKGLNDEYEEVKKNKEK